jgi:Tfp pilus assembly protein PilN
MRDYIHVNLLPIEYRVVKKDYTFLFDWRVLVGIIVVVSVALVFMAGRQFIEATLATKREALAVVEKEIAENGYVARKIQELESVRDEKTAKNNSLKSISVNKSKWVRILEGLSKSMPLNTWLETVRQIEPGNQEMEVRGLTYVFPEVAEYMMELEKGEYFTKVSLSTIEFKQEAESRYFMFTLRIHLNPTAGMQSFIAEPKPEKML